MIKESAWTARIIIVLVAALVVVLFLHALSARYKLAELNLTTTGHVYVLDTWTGKSKSWVCNHQGCTVDLP